MLCGLTRLVLRIKLLFYVLRNYKLWNCKIPTCVFCKHFDDCQDDKDFSEERWLDE